MNKYFLTFNCELKYTLYDAHIKTDDHLSQNFIDIDIRINIY